jgi:23S rRNA (adenine2030-N6)-methyltransferase
MNYRHAYHAGNFADVVKHTVLVLLLSHLRKKDTPFRVIDTHAGIGRYDLGADAAIRTGEWREGIGRLVEGESLGEPLADYLAAVAAVNPAWPELRFYPGSPRIARFHLRPQDHLVLVELHPEDVLALKREFVGDRQVGVHQDDAYLAIKALLPPPERRGLVLVDPPFENPDEFRRIARGIAEALRRWPAGIYAVWYPIKAAEPVSRFLGEMATLGRPCLTAELLLHPADREDRLNGCGMAVVNPPWMFDQAVDRLLPVLADRLGATGGTAVRWLVGPA